jgi:hypothetical protein
MNFPLRQIKIGGSLMVMLLLTTVAWAQPAAPASLGMLVKGTDRVIMTWDSTTNADGYRLYTSLDSVSFTLAATVLGNGSERTTLTGLTPATQYYAHVEAYDGVGASTVAATSFTTTDPMMVIDFPLDSLVQDSIIEVMSGRKFVAEGQVSITDAATNGLGAPALRYTQDELIPIRSYVRITGVLRANAANGNISEAQMGRSYSFWVKNDRPDLISVPLSIGKRNGSTVALGNDSVYVFTDHRIDGQLYSIKAAAPLADTAWHHITYVFDEPFTKLYIDGQLATSSDNADDSSPYPYPWEWDVNCCDRDAEIGALFNPAYGLIEYLGGTYNPGVRNFFYGQMARLKFWNYSLSDAEVSSEYGQLAADAPATATLLTNGVDRAIIGWAEVMGADGYRIYTSTDSVTFALEAEVMGDSIILATIDSLSASTDYYVHVTAFNNVGESTPTPVSFTSVTPTMTHYFPLDALQGDTAIVEDMTTTAIAFEGQLEVTDAASSGLGIPAVKFVQDELNGIQSYVRIDPALEQTDLTDPSVAKSFSFWVQNDNATIYSVPLSIGKWNGADVAFRNDSVFVTTVVRNGAPYINLRTAVVTGAPLPATTWHHIAYVFSEPFTYLYVNGQLAGTVEKSGETWDYPNGWDIFCCDRDAEMGALFNPSQGLVLHLNDTYDPGVRNFFSGHLARMRFYNYAITEQDIMDQYAELVQAAPPVASLLSNGVDRAIIGWDKADEADGYRIYTSTDSVTFTVAEEVMGDSVILGTIDGLSASTDYYVHVTSFGTKGESAPVPVSFTSVTPTMTHYFPLESLVGDTAISESMTSTLLPFEGQLTVTDAASSGLGIPAVKFNQDELQGIQSYVPLDPALEQTDLTAPSVAKSFSFWVQNDDATIYSVPLSIGKWNGADVAFRNDSVFVTTVVRNGAPYINLRTAVVIGAPLPATTWHHIAYVFSEPTTDLYINGQLAGTVDKSGETWDHPNGWDIFCCDRDAEMGALFNPSQGLVLHLNDSYDPGLRNAFSGHLARLRFYNYAITEQDILGQYQELVNTSIGGTALASLEVYPNPAQDRLNIRLDQPQAAQVTLLDLQGRVLQRATLINRLELNVSDLPSGLYLVQVRSEGLQVTQKVVISH